MLRLGSGLPDDLPCMSGGKPCRGDGDEAVESLLHSHPLTVPRWHPGLNVVPRRSYGVLKGVDSLLMYM